MFSRWVLSFPVSPRCSSMSSQHLGYSQWHQCSLLCHGRFPSRCSLSTGSQAPHDRVPSAQDAELICSLLCAFHARALESLSSPSQSSMCSLNTLPHWSCGSPLHARGALPIFCATSPFASLILPVILPSFSSCHQYITIFKINNKIIISNKKNPVLNAEAGSLVPPRTSFPGKVFNIVPGVGVMWPFTYLLWSLLPAELCSFQNLNSSESDCMLRWVL